MSFPLLDGMGRPVHAIAFFEHPHGPPKTSFADKECTTAHSHPLIADSNGCFPPIFFKDEKWWDTTDCTTYNWRNESLLILSPMGPLTAIGVCRTCGGTGKSCP